MIERNLILICAFISLFGFYCSRSEKIEAYKQQEDTGLNERIKKQMKAASSFKLEVDDMELRKAFKNEVREAIEKEDFEKLEQIADQINTSKERFPGGDSKISRFFEVIDPPSKQKKDIDWPKRLATLKRWKEKDPNSIYANLALAYCQIGYAWNLRGSSYASEVSKEGWQGFETMLLQAQKTLNEKSADRKICMAWYRAMQSLGIGLGWQKDKMLALFESGVAAEPLYYDLYEGHAVYLLPRWHGEEGDWVRFAENAADKIGGSEGDIIYAEIVWRVSGYYDLPEFFKEHKLSWKRIEQGFQAREQKYGPSYRYMNAYCLLAGGIGDKFTTRELVKKIGDRWEPDFWIEKKYYDGYKRWAFSITN